MVNKTQKLLLSGALLVTACSFSQAQILDRIKKKAEKAAEKVIDEAVNGKDQAEEASHAGDETAVETPARAALSTSFDFVRGDSLLFQDNLSGESVGSMPGWWKTSGSGQVVTVPGSAGKWLLLKEFTTYKLDTLLAMPENFSLEFDILTRSDRARDLNSISFGFARDNSVSNYISDASNDNAITSTKIHYWNEEVFNSSSDTKIYNSGDFDLAEYANAVMHVAIQVNGTQMRIYLDKQKVLDTRMFDPGARKYFYISPGTDLDNQAQIAISNFELRE